MPLMTATAAVCSAASGRASQPRGPRRRSSRTERAPAPSETTARSPVLEAAAWSITSPPTEKPMPPIRPPVTSGRRCEPGDGGVDVLARRPSRTGSGRPRSRRSRARRAGARRSRGGRASVPAAASPAGSGRRSRPRRCGRGRTRRRGRGRRSSAASPPRTGRPRSTGSTAARGRCVARIAIATGTTSTVRREHDSALRSPLGAGSGAGQASASARAGRRRARAARGRQGRAGSRSSPRLARRRRGRPRSRGRRPPARARRAPRRSPRVRPARQARVDAAARPRRASVDETAQQVVARPRPGLGRDERVDGRVHGDDRRCAGEQEHLEAGRRSVLRERKPRAPEDARQFESRVHA